MRNCYPRSFVKRFLLVLLVATFAVCQLDAQTPQYFKGLGTSTNTIPMNTAGSHCQQIYEPADFNTVPMNGYITKIYFRNSPVGNAATYTNFSVGFLQNTLTAFPNSTFLTGFTNALTTASLTLNGNPTAGGWYSINLATPFLYDNTKPLIVEIKYDSQTGGMSGFTTNATGNKRLSIITAPGPGTGNLSNLWGDFGMDMIPPGPCTNPPTPGTVSSTANPACSGTDFTLSISGGTTGLTQTYQWQSSLTGAPGSWSNIFGATNTTFTTAQTVNTYYRCEVTCGVPVASAPLLVTTNNCIPTYCTALYTTGSTCSPTNGDYINTFATTGGVTNINNNSGCTASGYTYFSSMNHSAIQGTIVNFSFSNGLDADGYKIWVDYNNNGTFEDATELMYASAATIAANASVTGSFTVPAGTSPGLKRMRVRAVFNTVTFTACSSHTYGETEDYNFTVIAATPCAGTPNAGSASASQTNILCAGTPFTLSLTGSSLLSGLTYQWQSGPTASGPWTNIGSATPVSTYTLTQTLTSVYYQAIVTCTNGGGTSTSTPIQITSSTGPVYATMPYAESFESTWINGCGTRDIPNQYWKNTPATGNQSWRRHDDGASAAWTTPTTSAYAPVASVGSFSARFHSDIAATGTTGALDVYLNCNTSTPFKRLQFDYINSTGTDSIVVELSTDGGVNFTRLDGVGIATAWTTAEIYFSSLSATTVVRFKGKSDAGTSDIGLDNIKLNNWADCSGTPTGGTVSATPTSGVCANTPINLTLAGATDGNAITYQWQASTDGGITWTDIVGATNFTATVFQTGTTIYRAVTNCLSSSLSANSSTVTVISTPIPGGTYTINANNPTDFPTGTNFKSFNDAYNAIKCGISSSVVFDVQTGLPANSGAYVEQLIMNGQIPNAAPTRTVTFKGNGNILTFAPTTNERAVIKLKNINYIIFDSLVINPTGTFGYGVQLSNDADSNIVRKCTINTSTSSATAASYAGIVINGSDTDPIGVGTTTALCDDNIIDGNTINGGYYGITLTATFTAGAHGNNKIINNDIRDFYSYGIYVSGTYNTLIEKNKISRPTRTAFGDFYGIHFTAQSNSCIVSKNRIFNPCGATLNSSAFYGINFNASTGSASNENTVVNNLIYGVNNNGTAHGLSNIGSGNVRYFHNTISLDSLGSTAGSGTTTRGYSQTGSANSIYFFDNLISISRGGIGIKHCVYVTTPFAFADNNDYFINSPAGSNSIGFYTSNRATIADWKTALLPLGQEQASLSAIPVYTDPSIAVADYHPNNGALDNKGTNLGTYDDIIGVVRDQSKPDIGAYEFIPSPCTLPLVTGNAVLSATTICQNQPVVLGLTIGAFGSSQTFQWQTSPTPGGPYTLIGTPMAVPDTIILSTSTLYYQCVIKCGTVSAVSNEVLLNVNPALATGVYTINSASATTYTGPATGTNFASFADAKAAMSCGVVGTGNVVFNVLTGANAGVYAEQLKLDSIKGVNVNRQIIFNGNGNTIAYSTGTSTERAVIKLSGADFITFDSLRIDASAALSYGYGVQLVNNADSNTFKRCTILANNTISSTNFAGVVINALDAGVISTGITRCDGNKFDKNDITGGYYGVTLVGSATELIANNQFTNNTIEEFYNYGIYAAGTYNTLIEGNLFTRPTRTSVGTAFPIYFTTAVSSRSSISKNRITKLFGGAPGSTAGIYGIYHNSVDAAAGNESFVTNNALYNLDGAGFIYGFYNVGSDNVFYYHNTISIDNTNTPSSATSVGFYQNTDVVGVQFINNIVTIRRATTGNPIRQAIYLGTTTTEVASNYNNLLVTGTNTSNFIGYRAGTNYATLAAWRTATLKDVNSLNYDPLYQDTANANYKPQMAPLDNQGTTLNIFTDILGNFRNPIVPDMGAWEVAAPAPCVAPPVAGTASVLPNTSICLEVPIRLTATGHSPLGSLTFQWQASTSPTGPWVDMGPVLYSPTFDTLSSVTNYYRCKVSCNGNDTYTTVTSITLNTIVLAGTYTIDPTLQPTWLTSGGAVGTNFQTVQSAVNALLCGMTGSVVFNVKGTFNEQVRVPYIPGTNAGSTVTFQSYNGVPSAAEITYASTNAGLNYTLKLDSCKYFTFRNMTISSTNTTNGRAVEFANTASFDSLSSCVINAPVTTSTANTMAAVYANALKGTNVVIKGNTISNGSSGINFSGTSVAVPTFDHLIDSNFVTGAYFYGIYANFTQRLKLSKNTVNVAAPLSATSYGIYATNCDSSYQLTNNKVNINNATTTVYGMYATLCDGSEINRGRITGNDIVAATGNTGSVYGMWLDASTTYTSVLNNTISINTTGAVSHGIYCNNAPNGNYYNNSVISFATGATKYAAYFLNSSATGLSIKNNIFSHKGGGKALYVNLTSGITSDYNLLYTTGTNLVERNGTNYPTLVAWRNVSSLELFSLTYPPAFVSNTDLKPDLANVDVWAMHGRGVQIASNTYDHENNARPTTLLTGVPDLGAYEFYPTALPTVLTATPAAPAANTEQTFMYGTDTVMKLKWGATAPPSIEVRRYSGVVPTGLAAQGLDSMYFYTKVDVPGGGNYDYDAKLYYLDPWLGSIAGLNSGVYQLGLGKTVPTSTTSWVVGSTSRNNVPKRMIYQTGVNFLDKFTGIINPYAPPVLPDKDSSNRGRRFWVAYPVNQLNANTSQQMVLYLSAQDPANVQVKINGTPWVRNYFVPGNTVTATEYLPKAGADNAFLNTAGLFDRGISINSDVPIVVYAHYIGNTSSGAAMLMPVGVWGYEYKTLGITQSWGTGGNSYFYVIADNDNTVIDVTPTVGVSNPGMSPGTTTTVTLNKGQVFQVVASSLTQELTGSTVKSVPNADGKCFPIATFSGTSRTTLSLPCGGGGDFMMQQNFPSTAWGKRYLTAPSSLSTTVGGTPSLTQGNLFRIAVKDPATIVTRNNGSGPVQLTNLINNHYYQYQSTTADYIEADKPIMVAQYLSGACSGVGDPEMMYISPIEQGINNVGFYRNNVESIQTNHLTMIIPDNGMSSLVITDELAGVVTPDYIYSHPGLPGYKVVVKNWGSAQSQVRVTSDSNFTGITYGLGSVESYGYNIGTKVKNLQALGNTVPQFLPTGNTPPEYICAGTPFKFTMLLPVIPGSIIWKLASVPNLVNITQNNTTAQNVTISSPVPSGTVFINGTLYYKFTLPDNYMFTVNNIYTVPVTYTHETIESCDNTQTDVLIFQVIPAPAVGFDITFAGCAGNTAQFTAANVTPAGVGVYNWTWSLTNGVITTHPTGPTQTMIYPNAGTFMDSLHVVTADGCIRDTAKPVVVNPLPVVAAVVDSAAICTGDNYTITIQSPLAGATYNWYDAPVGGTLLYSGTSHAFTNVTADSIMYIEGISAAGCTSTVRKKVVVHILSPLTPTVATVSSSNANSVTFGWTAVTGAASYQVSTDGGTTWVVPSSGATGLTHTVTGLGILTSTNLLVQAIGTISCQTSVSPSASGCTNSSPIITVDSVAICTGGSNTYTVDAPLPPNVVYSWFTNETGGTALTNGGAYTINATGSSFGVNNITVPGIYYYYAANNNTVSGCAGTVRKKIVLNVLAPLAPVTVTVTGNTANSVTFSWNAVPGATYQVSTNGGTSYGLPSSGATGLTHTVTGLGILTNASILVQAIGTLPCQTSTSTAVSGCTNSPAVITPDSVAICSGNSYTYLVNTPLPANVVYTWYTVPTGGTALTSGGAYTINTTPVAGSSFTVNSLSPAGVYNYYAGQSNTVTGCVASDRKKVVINVLAPLAKPVVTVTTASITPTTVTFAWPAVAGAVGYEVSTNNGTSWITPSSGANGLTHTVSGMTPNTSVTILVRALGILACQTSISDAVTGKTLIDQVYVPNAFNPNSTAPENRVLRVYGYIIQSMQFMVFNQWGEKVFESTSQTAGWDGTYKGKQQPSGVYIYLLKFTTVSGTTQEMKGSISLIR